MARTKEGKEMSKKSIAKVSGKKMKKQEKERKPHRYRPGTVALREIKKY